MDSISNMIIMMKNASLAGKESVSFPSSKIKSAISECLKKEGFISSVSKKVKGGIPVIEVGLIYVDKKPKITEVERISKQSRRVYFGVKDIHTIRNGFGLLVLSTPKGILSGKEARKEQVGGEALFKIW
ncbi:30S ribosomal protein S8 [Patescibacteria group bacterium]|nr:30S ribosomal protein S8 [Patescibacteria group bacterium]MBU1728230.1 30S ribosomal protein S8 [Patescibacteria group bacterium]